MSMFFDTIGGKKVAFIGAGVSHKELISMFAKSGAQVTLCDKKRLADLGDYGEELLELGVKLSLGESYLDGLFGKDMILRTPGFDYFNPTLQKAGHEGAVITSEIELFFEYCPCKTIGITGSDGKTTTTSIVAAMYEAEGKTVHLGGNIGRPLLPIVDTIHPSDIAIVELSSFQLVSMRQSPDIAVVTNVTPNHLDHHKNMDEYVDAKKNILLHQNGNGVAVLGYDNEISRNMHEICKGEVRYFSANEQVGNSAYLNTEGMLHVSLNNEETDVINKHDIPLRGAHNVLNVLAAIATCKGDVSVENMVAAIKNFKGVEHRIEFVRNLNGVEWYNDSIASSPTRVIAGLNSFDKKIILIAGGYDKNIPFEPMTDEIIDKVKILILMGQTGPLIEEAIKNNENFANSPLQIIHAQDMADAVSIACSKAQEGDIVNLSPASASFDAYANFEERGKHFKSLVHNL